jgi:flagellar biosynthesis protein FlhG
MDAGAAWAVVPGTHGGVREGPTAGGGARVVVVTGGKGGIGKSNFSLNFGLALRERGRRVLLVDGDSGMGSLDLLLGLRPARHLGHVLLGVCTAWEALVQAPLGMDLLPAASGLQAQGDLPPAQLERLGAAVASLARAYDVCLLDAGAGLGPLVTALLHAATERVVLTTPEPTALADAYATCKAIAASTASGVTWLVVNMAETAAEAEATARGLVRVCQGYLDWSPRPLGWVPRDPRVGHCVRAQQPFLLAAAQGPAARALRGVAAAFCAEAPPARGPGWGEALRSLVRPRGGQPLPEAWTPPGRPTAPRGGVRR